MHTIIDASSGISPLGPSKKVRAGIRKAIKGIGRYPDSEALALKKLFLSKYGIRTENLCLAQSMDELIYRIPAVIKPEKVLVFGPALNIYEEASSAAGADTFYVNPDEHTRCITDTEQLKNKIKDSDLLFAANPNRINGRVFQPNVFDLILSEASAKKAPFVIDESLIEFSDAESCHKYIGNMKNIIVLQTTAFFYGLPGLELAYAVASPEMVIALKSRQCSAVNHLSLEAARIAFKDNVYRKNVKKYIDAEKAYIKKKIKRARGVEYMDSDSPVFLIKLPHKNESLLRTIKKAGFHIQDCKDINGLHELYLRLSVLKHDYNSKLLRIIVDRL
jgi:threonine-phosphate decarboxylase